MLQLKNFFSYQDQEENQEIVFIDGNISSGKSTLCEEFKKSEDGETSTVPIKVDVFHEIGHEDGVLAKYLEHSKELSSPFQIHMLSMCAAREKCVSLIKNMKPVSEEKKHLLIVDRSITGNGIFGLANHVFSKSLSDIDFDFYKKVFAQQTQSPSFTQAFKHGTLSIYLHVPAHVSVERCAIRDRTEEQKYDVLYFKSIERAATVAILSNLGAEHPHPQLLLDWGPVFGKIEVFNEIMKAFMALKTRKENPVVTRVTLSRSPCGLRDVDTYSSILDFSFLESEDEFFSYENAMTFMSLLCCRSSVDVSLKKHLFIQVPRCLTETPFNGPFKLNILF